MTGSRLYQESDHDCADGLMTEVRDRFNWMIRLNNADQHRLMHRLVRATRDCWGINPNGGTHEIARDARVIVFKEFKCRAARDLVGAEQTNVLSVWMAGKLRP